VTVSHAPKVVTTSSADSGGCNFCTRIREPVSAPVPVVEIRGRAAVFVACEPCARDLGRLLVRCTEADHAQDEARWERSRNDALAAMGPGALAGYLAATKPLDDRDEVVAALCEHMPKEAACALADLPDAEVGERLRGLGCERKPQSVQIQSAFAAWGNRQDGHACSRPDHTAWWDALLAPGEAIIGGTASTPETARRIAERVLLAQLLASVTAGLKRAQGAQEVE
jgi:hypothetical protein